MRPLLALWPALTLLPLTLGCGGATPHVEPAPAPAVTTPAPPEATPTLSEFLVGDCKTNPGKTGCGARDTYVEDKNHLTVALFAKLRETPGNLVFSPHSVSDALGMAYLGSAGTTRKAIQKVLRDRVPPGGFATAVGDLTTTLREVAQRQPLDYTLDQATRIWVDDDTELAPEYVTAVGIAYGADPAWVDFRSAPDEAREEINTWVQWSTRDRIPELLSKAAVTRDTRVILTNAIYFKAGWAGAFDRALTAARPFFSAGAASTKVPTMMRTSEMGYGTAGTAEIVDMSYGQFGHASMVLVVPPKGGLAAFEASLDEALLRQIIAPRQSMRVELQLPKFSFRTSRSLNEPLSQMGMAVAFSDKANFGAMSVQPLKISDVAHEAFISVDEEGTEAAAATAVTMVKISAGPPQTPVKVHIDRPFLFFVKDARTGIILFAGRVTAPGTAK